MYTKEAKVVTLDAELLRYLKFYYSKEKEDFTGLKARKFMPKSYF